MRPVQSEPAGREVLPARRLTELLGPLDRDAGPRYAALAARVRLLVSEGRLPVAARLPAERDLAAVLGLSRATVTAAYARLRADGWAVARQGAGTWTALPEGPLRGAWLPAPPVPGVLDLAHAAPAAAPEVAAALAAALDDLPRLLPSHGYSPGGLPELRTRIAERYTARGLPTSGEQVLVTAGALHGGSVALAALARRGSRLLVEHPTYPNALDAARGLGLRALPVAVGDDGPQAWVERAERALRAGAPGVAYLMPDFANPTGQLLQPEHRVRLGRALRRSGTRAVVDETLVELGLDEQPGPPLGAYDAGVVSAGTLSKAFWGGLRIGWLRADLDTVQRLAEVSARSYLSAPVVEQLAACALLDRADGVLERHRAGLRERRDLLVAELRRALPDWRVPVPAGGLVLWCGLPAPRSTVLTLHAQPLGLLLAAGPRFGTGAAFEDRLRLPYTAAPDVLRRAVELLARADAAASGGAPVPAQGVPPRTV